MGTQSPRPAAGQPAAGEPVAPLDRLRRLGPQWASASGDAFAGMAQSPERYAAAARLVAAWLDRLRGAGKATIAGASEAGATGGGGEAGGAGEVHGPECDEDHDEEAQTVAAALLDAWDGRESGAGPAAGLALPLTGAERAALTAAAFAIRYGEVTEWLASRRRHRAMARAAGRRAGWLVLSEAGDPAGDPFVAYRRLEVDPVTGAGVLVETRPDDNFTGVVHVVHAISVDPASGALTADNSSKYWEFGTVEEREERVSELRSGQAR
jgi:hypothetical protein